MSDLFKIKAEIEVSADKAKKTIRETSEEAGGASKQLGKLGDSGITANGKLGKFFSGFASGCATLAKATAIGIGAAASAIGALTVKALSSAGELEQNMGGAESVFKALGSSISEMNAEIIVGYDEATGKAITAVKSLEEISKTAFENMGLSQSDYLATANKMGALFQGAGFDTQTALDMSSSAMQRAADVASIMGIDTASAMEAIAGAAKGNFTMMDNLGVAMNDTTIQAYALSKGIDKSTAEMTNQEKISLAMEMFMEKTAYAAGNYAKENETLAGSLGTAKAAFSNFLSGAGSAEDVVSSFSNVADVVVNKFTELFPPLMAGVTKIITGLVPKIPSLIETILPALIEGAVGLIDGLVTSLPTILQVLTSSAIPQLLTGIIQILNALISALPMLVQGICAALPPLIPILINGIVQLIVALCTMLPQLITPIVAVLPTLIQAVCEAIMQNLPVLITALISLIIGIVDALPMIIQALVDSIPYIIEMVITTLFACREALINGAIRLVGALVGALPQIMASLREALPKAFLGIWNGVKNIFKQAPQWFADRFNAVVDGVAKAFTGIKAAIVKPFEKARDLVKNIADKIRGFFKGEISMPKIKMPHFSIKPSGWKISDLLEGSIPKLGIDWYAKAMSNPMVMTKPTVFGYNAATGNLQAGGEVPGRGGEMIGGTNTIMSMISAAVTEPIGALEYYLQKIIEVLGKFFPQVLDTMAAEKGFTRDELARMLAEPIDYELGRIKAKKARGRA